MRKENISKIIDDNIISKSIKDGLTFDSIILDLSKRRDSIFKIIKSDKYKECEDVIKIDPEIFEVKFRYVIYFIQISTSRINDLKWVLKNKDRLSEKYNDSKIFGLLKLKSKLENETH